MKPLEGWPRGRSTLAEYGPCQFDRQDVEQVNDFLAESYYHDQQNAMTDAYRAGEANAFLPEDVVQMIRWMAGTPQFLSHSGLQIVPMTEERFFELEKWLEVHRACRGEEWYTLSPAFAPYRINHDLLDPWNEEGGC